MAITESGLFKRGEAISLEKLSNEPRNFLTPILLFCHGMLPIATYWRKYGLRGQKSSAFELRQRKPPSEGGFQMGVVACLRPVSLV
jgi:hypothetical protein